MNPDKKAVILIGVVIGVIVFISLTAMPLLANAVLYALGSLFSTQFDRNEVSPIGLAFLISATLGLLASFFLWISIRRKEARRKWQEADRAYQEYRDALGE